MRSRHGHGATAEAALAELHRLRDWLGLAHVLVTDRGDFAPRYRRSRHSRGTDAQRPGKRTMVRKKSSIWRTTDTKEAKPTGLVT